MRLYSQKENIAESLPLVAAVKQTHGGMRPSQLVSESAQWKMSETERNNWFSTEKQAYY